MTWGETLGRLRPETVSAAAIRWGTGPVTLVNPGFNYVYRAEDSAGPLYLRFTHVALRNAEYLGPPLQWLRFLHTQGAPVNEPLPSLDGCWTEAVTQEDDLFLATAVRGVVGPRLSGLPPGPRLYQAFGRSIGQLHAASLRFMPEPSTPPMLGPALLGVFPSWRLFWHGAREHALKEPVIAATFGALTPWVDAVGGPARGWPDDSASATDGLGLTHGDLRPGNAIWDGERVVIIDFDEPVYGPLATDLARAVMEIPRGQRAALWAAVLTGYREVLPLGPAWDRELPRLLRSRAALMAAWNISGGADLTDVRPISGTLAPVSLWRLREHLLNGEYDG
ncbi:phosphotransferase enzyme family protein [Deinococcus hopiensis]|uniref:Ser/Thr protein kinase RdoA involved in Cpx stress response, MazF antagonist n=1 Tax=Deinococcus hopiensis KR-140 TaxID=695939 RepID=A0A1W1VU97_9DEIO|nr:phosphotransferase [Deinococcus hopiensis]SMB96896.1 Ser/Thr protein kinase RdoA involved in Cpx stress response, MazF antagonist [Deinococcus hopiensis KR-140]